ncbi:MAG: PQQ-binding-like beta-propeller repeat protein [Myxococcota bacterium]
MNRLPSNCIIALLGLLVGCGGGTSTGGLSLTFPDNRDEDVEAVLARMALHTREDRPVIVAAGTDPDRLMAFDLASGRPLWDQPTESKSAPFVAGELVITHESSGVVGRTLDGGTVVFTQPDEAMHLSGADGDGAYAAFALSTGGGVGARSKIFAVRGGAIAWELELEQAVGRLAVHGSLLFLPWGNQNVSVLDLDTEQELARVRIVDDVVGAARVVDNAVYVGQNAVFRIDPAITAGNRDAASSFTPRAEEFPGNPPFFHRAYEPPPAPRSALHRIRQEWRPSGTTGPVALSDSLLYLVFFRLVFALDPVEGTIRWAYATDADVVGASAQAGGILFVDNTAAVHFISAEGRHARVAEGNTTLAAATVQAGSFVPQTSGESPPDLPSQLMAVAQNSDARLTPARVLAVQALAAIEDPVVTAHLIGICDGRNIPEPVREAGCAALGERTLGPDELLGALGRHQRFLEETSAPPIGALSQAAVRMEERRAVPLLLSHLRDPETRSRDLAPLLEAVAALGDASHAGPVRDFLRLYHADRADTDFLAALGAAATTLVALQGEDARETLEGVIADPMGIPEVRGLCREALAAFDAPTEEEAEEETAESEETAEGEPDDGRVERMTSAIVSRVLSPVADQLSACVRNAPGHPMSARLVLAFDGNGNVDTVSVVPATMQACVEPLIRSQTFPANRRARPERLSYVLRR